jgi:acetate---CoA ligase (ADP-forming)
MNLVPPSASASRRKLADHRLAPLLMPRSIALVGASAKEGSVGHGMVSVFKGGAFPGEVYLVNPNYQEIEGLPCYPSLAALPEPVDHTVMGVATARLEGQMAEAIKQGARGATIFASGYLENDSEPRLTQRIAAMAREAGMQICGGNCMGFYNLEYGLRVCGFLPPPWLSAGPIAFITHSGSAYSALCHNDRRFRFSLAVSAGQELTTNAADYVDFALEMETTKVVGLFLETVRDPPAFVAALEKAEARDIPMVVLKVGRTAESAALALSHSGAMAGNDAAYQALFDRYGVMQVDDLDQLANALLLFSQPRRLARGGVASIHDSGGLRELTIDVAAAHRVPLAKINPRTTERLAARLDYGLEPVNPVDAWGTGHDWEGIFRDCLTALVQDPDTALGILFAETRSGYYLHEGYAEIVRDVAAQTDKPVIMANNMACLGNDDLAVHMTHDGYPVLIGIGQTMAVLRAAMAHRDHRALPPMRRPAAPVGAQQRWAARLQQGTALDESESLRLFDDYGIPVLPHHVAENAEEVQSAALELGFPLALKTAMPGILHKSDVGGVKLGVATAEQLRVAYDDLARRLGPRAIVMPMAGKGIELAFGAIADPQFGPIVMAGAGGTLIEILADRRFAMPPFDGAAARRLIDRLKVRRLLEGARGAEPANVDAVADALARFSAMVADLGDLIAEVDVNPVLCSADGCVALDALVVGRAPAEKK